MSSPLGSDRSSDTSSVSTTSLAAARSSSAAVQHVLPPLPPHGPSPPGRSSSPRYHASATPSTRPDNSRSNLTSSQQHQHNFPSTPSSSRRHRHQRHRRPSSSLQLESRRRVEAPDEWSEDESFLDDTSALSISPSHSHSLHNIIPSDDSLLEGLAENEFSSPSSYLPFTTTSATSEQRPPPRTPPNHFQAVLESATALASASASATGTAAASLLRRLSSSTSNRLNFAGPSRTNTLLTNSSHGESQGSLFVNDYLPNDEQLTDTPDTSFSESMPTTQRRNSRPTSSGRDTLLGNKRQRVSPGPQTSLRNIIPDSDDSFFGNSPIKPTTAEPNTTQDTYDTIDLTEATEIPKELTKPKVDNRIKLSGFQCVICMDDVTTLTVTHCGMLEL